MTRPHKAPALAALALALAACDARDSGAPATALPTETWLARGQKVYLEHCAACHGERGEGQPDWAVPLEDGSLPASPHDSSGHTWHHSDAELLDIIDRGGTFYLPASKMPAFGATLDPDDRRAALAYIKTFWGPEEAAYQAELTATDEARGATRGAEATAAAP